MTKWYHTLKAALTPAECQELIAHATTYLPDQTGIIGHGGKAVDDPAFRRSRIRWMPRDDAKLQPLFNKIDVWVRRANADHFGLAVSHNQDVQFTEYRWDQDGKYDWHEDSSWLGTSPFDRKLSVSIQLAHPDTFGGGVLELARENPAPDPAKFGGQGDVIIFPSFLRHRVTPVTQGIRYSLVAWYLGPRLC